MWSSDSRQVIAFSDMQLRATVWSLVQQQPIAVLQGPKMLPPKGADFSENGKFMALLEKKEHRDWVSVYYAGADWKMLNSFEVGGELLDAQDVKWTMRNTSLLVQDSSLESRYAVFSALTGQVLALHCPSDPKQGLGIRNLTISPSQKIVACGLFQTEVSLYNNLTQRDLARLSHPSSIQITGDTLSKQGNQPTVYKEERKDPDASRLAAGMASAVGYQYINCAQTLQQ